MKNTEFRNRVILPIVLPLAVLVGLGLFVGSVSLTLLYSTKTIAILLAGVMAAGIMVAMSLASTQDEDDLDGIKRAVIGATGVLPILGSFGIAVYLANGGVDPAELQINKQPVLLAPDGALVGAQNSENFCALEEVDGPCEDTQELTLPFQEEAPFSFQFNNQQANVPHNFQIFELAEDGGEPAPGEPIFTIPEGSATFNGPATQVYQVADFAPEVDAQFYFNCVVHPVMEGVLTIVEPDA